MIVTQKIFDTIRNFQVDMSEFNLDIEEIKLSQVLTEDFNSDKISTVLWIRLTK